MDVKEHVALNLNTDAKDIVGAINEVKALKGGGGGGGDVQPVKDAIIMPPSPIPFPLQVANGLDTDADTIVEAINELDDKIKHMGSGGVAYKMEPDLDKIETVNRWAPGTATSGTWTCDRDGYVQCHIFSQSPAASNPALNSITVNGVELAQARNGASGVVMFIGNTDFFEVREGDVIAYTTQGPPYDPSTCFFIPPVWKAIDLESQEVVGEPTPIIDWIVKEKHDASTNEYNYTYYASGKVVLTISGLTYSQVFGQDAYGTVAIPLPTMPSDVTPVKTRAIAIKQNFVSNSSIKGIQSTGITTVDIALQNWGYSTTLSGTVDAEVEGTWSSPVRPIKLLGASGSPNKFFITIAPEDWSNDPEPIATVGGVKLAPRVFSFSTSADPLWESYGIKGYAQTEGDVSFVCTGDKPTTTVVIEMTLLTGEPGGVFIQRTVDVVVNEIQYMGYKHDGKKVYRKVLLMPSLPNSSATGVPHGIIGMKDAIHVYIAAITGAPSTPTTISFDYVYAGDSVYRSGDNIIVQTSTTRNNYHGYIHIYFTYEVEPEDPNEPALEVLKNDLATNYSMSEQPTGIRWFDNRMIYQKSFYIASMVQQTWNHNIDGFDMMTHFHGNMRDKGTSGAGFAIPMHTGNASTFVHTDLHVPNKTQFTLARMYDNYTNWEGWVTVQYVCTNR